MVIVFLGIKYHWVKVLESDDKTTILTIPPEQINVVNTRSEEISDQFQPEIIRTQFRTSQLQDLSKKQINHFCRSLFNNVSRQEASLLIGNCVVSNYHEPLRDLAQNSTISTINRQKLSLKNNIKKDCENQISQINNTRSDIEQKLLIGICVSNTLSKQSN